MPSFPAICLAALIRDDLLVLAQADDNLYRFYCIHAFARLTPFFALFFALLRAVLLISQPNTAASCDFR
jgi:hypothetical protein